MVAKKRSHNYKLAMDSACRPVPSASDASAEPDGLLETQLAANDLLREIDDVQHRGANCGRDHVRVQVGRILNSRCWLTQMCCAVRKSGSSARYDDSSLEARLRRLVGSTHRWRGSLHIGARHGDDRSVWQSDLVCLDSATLAASR